MKFTIASVSYCNDELLEEYPFLTNYGFETLKKTIWGRIPTRDENGKRIYQLASMTRSFPCIHIDTLEQLVDFSNKVGKGNSIIIAPGAKIYDAKKEDYVDIGVASIEIYDGYRE